MPVEGSVYSTCERKSELISDKATSIFLVWMSKSPMGMVPRSSESLRTVFRHSGGKPQSMTTGRLNLSRAGTKGAEDALASNR